MSDNADDAMSTLNRQLDYLGPSRLQDPCYVHDPAAAADGKKKLLYPNPASCIATEPPEPHHKIVREGANDIGRDLLAPSYATYPVTCYAGTNDFTVDDDYQPQDLTDFAVDAGPQLQGLGYATDQSNHSSESDVANTTGASITGYAATHGYQLQGCNYSAVTTNGLQSRDLGGFAFDSTGYHSQQLDDCAIGTTLLQPQQLSNFATDIIEQEWAQNWPNSTIDTNLSRSQDMSGFAVHANVYQSQTPVYAIANAAGVYHQGTSPFVTGDAGFHSRMPGNNPYVNASDYGFPNWNDMANDTASNRAQATPLMTALGPIAATNTGIIMPTAPATTPTTKYSGDGDGDTADLSRPTCPRCGQTFGRAADLARHAGKHDPAKRTHRCPVQGCDYRGNYRKDKLINHVKNCHPSVYVS